MLNFKFKNCVIQNVSYKMSHRIHGFITSVTLRIKDMEKNRLSREEGRLQGVDSG